MENKELIKELDGLIASLAKEGKILMDNEIKQYPTDTDFNVVLNNIRNTERALLSQTLKGLRDKIAQ